MKSCSGSAPSRRTRICGSHAISALAKVSSSGCRWTATSVLSAGRWGRSWRRSSRGRHKLRFSGCEEHFKMALGFGAIGEFAISEVPTLQISLPRTTPGILMQLQFVELGEKTHEGTLIRACDLPWAAVVELLQKDDELVKLLAQNPRKFEELIAAYYQRDGFEVVLTPRSGDYGRDIIATMRGKYQVRFLEQVKAYSPSTPVTHDDIRAAIGVLHADSNASKIIVTTTSRFQPKVRNSPQFAPYVPYRLLLRDRDDLIEWFKDGAPTA